ncbi:MAG: CDGSH iron-sulfur domain-containing protein [Gammaproteobacteria bacterium]|nr:CDGSH iron-sulfur domain-containing protein [Gammaproteobacteria bacterium]MDE2252074.1 CDGSH iron-sulfur domain-containing protein [Gammaproteobacteria bacterium]
MASKVETVRGAQATIRFDAGKCIHSRHCVLDRPDVFVPNVEGEWIHPERASAEEIAALAANCPSGAITCVRHDGKPDEAAPLVNTVRVRENGPLAFHAELALPEGARALRATLCRCGASANKPYCDGSHAAAGFGASGEPKTAESRPLPVRNGTLTVSPQADGPLKVSGPLELVSGTGRTLNRTTETYLCRCGASANKPYCDGSHKRSGFKSD